MACKFTTALLLFVAVITILTVYGYVAVFGQVTIVAPVLTKAVTLDGRITSGDEWSDASPVAIGLYATTGPSDRRDAVIWAKHDDKWVYLLFRLTRYSGDSPQDSCGISYFWGPGTIGSKGKPSALGGVNKQGVPQEFYGWDGTRWYPDTSATGDVEGALVQSGNYAWCEFRKKLNSGLGHDWSLFVGNTYGETEGTMFALAMDASNQKIYSERIALSLLSTTLTITRPTTTGTVSSTTNSTSFLTGFFGGLDTTRLFQIAGAAGTGGSIVIGWLFKTRKRRFMSNYLTKIDSTFNEYSLNQEDCKNRLGKMKEEISHLLKKGKIDEAQFTLLDNKILQHLKNLGSSVGISASGNRDD